MRQAKGGVQNAKLSASSLPILQDLNWIIVPDYVTLTPLNVFVKPIQQFWQSIRPFKKPSHMGKHSWVFKLLADFPIFLKGFFFCWDHCLSV
jgi:hypothetical protein